MITVPVLFGKVIVRSSVGSSTASVVSKSSGEFPSITIGEVPERIPIEVAWTPVILEPSPLNEFAVIDPVIVALPVTAASPATVRLSPTVTSDVP